MKKESFEKNFFFLFYYTYIGITKEINAILHMYRISPKQMYGIRVVYVVCLHIMYTR